MIRIPKDYIDGALYYVTARGDHNEEIFKEQGDYKVYVELLKKYKEQYGFKLFSFVLLSNHLHLLFELKQGLTISDIMHDLNANYTKYFNAKYKRKGHLFQERGKVVLAEKETYLLSIIAHTHLNPLSLKLVTAIDGYPYSSHILYADIAAKDSILEGLDLTEEIKEVLKKLLVIRLAGQPVNQLILRQPQDTSSKDTEQSRSAEEPANRPTGELANKKLYSDFIKCVPQEQMDVLSKDLAKKQILGSEAFLQKVQQKMEEKKSELSAAGIEINGYRKKTAKQQNLIFAGSAAVILMGVVTLYLYNRGLELRKNLKNEIVKKEVELSDKIIQERKIIVQDLEEKHQADMVSYNAMAKRLEYEKQKALELEAKIR